MTKTTHTVTLDRVGPVEVTLDEHGEGQPFLLLHGGGGPGTVAGFAELLAGTHPARVISPTHPGFGGTHRPEALHTVGGLAALYVALLDQLDLRDVTVVGGENGITVDGYRNTTLDGVSVSGSRLDGIHVRAASIRSSTRSIGSPMDLW